MSQTGEILVSAQTLQVPYTYSAGPMASKFLTALRDEKKIYGIWCPDCNRVLVPPRSVCGKCGSELKDWMPLSGRGKLVSYTVVRYAEATHPLPAPWGLAVIQLEGAHTGFTHLLGEVDEKKLRVGLAVEPVFARERRGHILDIAYFRPVGA